MRDDAELLRRYALEHDNDAFSQLVHRSIDLVYGIALRQCQGNAALAQDITQLVFTDLSRRARTLLTHPALAGWLHTATRFAAMKVLRGESRRRLREQQAAQEQAVLADEGSAIDWARLQPVLDDAISELKERDRAAILLRFFQGKSLVEVGANLQLSETAARSCVDRALDRLRRCLIRHGVTSTCVALSLVFTQQVSAAAPAGLATTVSGIALTEGAIGGAALIPLLAMKKIILTTAVLALAAEIAAATVELKTKRSLESDYRQLEIADTTPGAVNASAPGPVGVSVNSSVANMPADEQAQTSGLEKRLAQLRARPPGVIDAQMKTPRAVGRATPKEAMQTLTAAVRDRDMGTLDRFVTFSDDTPENRAAFMANFSEAVRARYQTPERLMVAFSFDQVLHDPPVAQQILEAHGYSGGVQTVTAWTQLASGFERKDTIPFQKTPNGWALSSLQLTGKNNRPLELMRARIDPVTGSVLPPKQ